VLFIYEYVAKWIPMHNLVLLPLLEHENSALSRTVGPTLALTREYS